MSWIDLHMHSVYSNDGDITPEALVEQCKEAGVKVMAIADHNCIRAISAAKKKAEELGIDFISAIELDCMFRGKNFHVLGYGIDDQFPMFDKIEEELAKGERASSLPRIALVRGLGLTVNEEQAYALSHNGFVTGEVVAEVVLADERNEEKLMLEPYREGGSRSDNPYVNFYWDICAQGKPAYVPIPMISMDEAIQAITDAGGIAILAHPGNNVKEDAELLDAILEKNICGLEVYSSYHSIEQVAYYRAKVEKGNLLMTAGSDYHGKTKPAIHLGKNGCDGNEEQIMRGIKSI